MRKIVPTTIGGTPRRGAPQVAQTVDLDRAMRLNRHYRRALGWGTYADRLARLAGLTGPSWSEADFAASVAGWQRRQTRLKVDGVIGPLTLPRMRTALLPAPAINVGRAVRLNRRYRQSLGWQAYTSSILRLLGFAATIPGESVFAVAVARWQRTQGSLLVDGIIGPQTLRAMRPVLESLTTVDLLDTRRDLSSHEFELDSVLLRRLERELAYEMPEAADLFVTEVPFFGKPLGHQLLTSLAAAGLPTIGPLESEAMREGVSRPDNWLLAFNPAQQRRHVLRRTVCQAVPVALSEARDHLDSLHRTVLGSPTRQIQFEFIGEALHLIQDSFSEAHTERSWDRPGGFHPILFIRFFGFGGSLRYPIEHQVYPPPDPRDLITAGKTLIPWARESVTVSREFLHLILRHLYSPPPEAVRRAELLAFTDRHLSLSPSHTPTRHFYPSCPP